MDIWGNLWKWQFQRCIEEIFKRCLQNRNKQIGDIVYKWLGRERDGERLGFWVELPSESMVPPLHREYRGRDCLAREKYNQWIGMRYVKFHVPTGLPDALE
jgi:hypothetical protein